MCIRDRRKEANDSRAEANRLSDEANGLRTEANRLREEQKGAVVRIAELQDERNQLEGERNRLMEKIAENTRRPLSQAEKNALKLRKYLRKLATVSEGNGNWGAMGAEIVDVSEDNILTLFVPAGYSSTSAYVVYVHCDELQIVEEPVGSCALQIKILKRYGDTLQLGEIRKWEDRRTPSTAPLPRGGNVFHADYSQGGSSKRRGIYIYAPTEGNPQYTLVTLDDGKETEFFLLNDDAIEGCNAASIKLKILGSTEYDDLRGEPTVLLGIRPERKSA